jgi:hypothetical protein
VLESQELTILTSWAEALAEALTFAPERIEAVPANGHTGAAWRTSLGLAEPSPQLEQAIESIDEVVRTTIGSGIPASCDIRGSFSEAVPALGHH